MKKGEEVKLQEADRLNAAIKAKSAPAKFYLGAVHIYGAGFRPKRFHFAFQLNSCG